MTHPAEPVGGDVDHHQERGVQQQRGAEVLLEHHHADRDDPGRQQRRQVARPGQVHAEHVLAGAGEQAALGHQHRREEDQQQDLGELGGLNREAGQPNPDLGAVLLRESSGAAPPGWPAGPGRPGRRRSRSAPACRWSRRKITTSENADDPDQGPQHLLVGARAAHRRRRSTVARRRGRGGESSPAPSHSAAPPPAAAADRRRARSGGWPGAQPPNSAR